MATNWETLDHAQIVTVLNGATLTAGSAGFDGISEDRDDFPEPSSTTTAPVVFALWETDYVEAHPVFDRSTESAREALLNVDIFVQKGAPRGYLNTLAGELRTAFSTGDGSGVVFLERMALLEPLGDLDSYNVTRWVCPFWGGAA